MTRSQPSPGRRGLAVGAMLAAAASMYLLWRPVYAGSLGGATLLAVNGTRVLWAILLPLVLTLIPLLVTGVGRRRVATRLCTAALGGFVVLTGFSIGLLYAPSLVALAWSTGQPASQQAPA
jgi:hypothetical protein